MKTMKKIFTFLLLCVELFCLTGCSLGNLFQDPEEKYYRDERYFDPNSMDTMNVDIKKAIEKAIEDSKPLKMRDGNFHIDNNTFIHTSEEGTTKTTVKFEKLLINALPKQDNPTSSLFFMGTIKIEFENVVEGTTYTITSKNVKEISFRIEGNGTSSYNDKTGKLLIKIPELKQTGTSTQTKQEITTTLTGSVDEGNPITNTWEINETFENYQMSFVPHANPN